MPQKKPKSIALRLYQVGFGDCSLVSFDYGTFDRHVLIDFGSTGRPKSSPKDLMLKVANDIKKRTSGKLHVIAVSHRHKDHLSGFSGKTGTIIKQLDPDVVIQPWTEDPDAQVDARQAKQTVQKNLTPMHTLANMERIAGQAVAMARRLGRHDRDLAERLNFIGEDNVKNKEAVKTLMKLGKTRRYVREGNSAGLGHLLPGVKTHILGPPSLKQTETIRKQTDTHDTEFWHLQANAGDLGQGGKRLFPRAAVARTPGHARWFLQRMHALKLEQLLQLVLELDNALNNTSLILLFEAGGRKLLFPGDAQWENWQHALGRSKYSNLLKDAALYKVGHHGSLNATPKSLWKLFKNRSETASSKRLVSLLSTLADKHGHEESGTEVPRRPLLKALEDETKLFNTQSLSVTKLFHDVTIPL